VALVPEHIGPYRVLRPIAAGGMAEVYEVEDPASSERFALKLLVAVKQALPRFDLEYEAMTRLNHPGIVRVYHYGLHAGQPWLTMELLRGQPAQSYLKQSGRAGDPQRTAEVLRIAYHVAHALQYIHDRNLIHRDLKSANVLVLPDGRVKLLDFGAALIADSARRITQEGEFIGTYSYCSPEQLAGTPIDSRSDLFSLGVLLFRLATGKRPFDAEHAVDLAGQHRSDIPRVSSVVEGLPEGLSTLIAELLSFDPAKRPAHANIVAQRLEELAGKPFSSRSRLAVHNRVSVSREPERRQVWSRIDQGTPGWIAVEGEDGSDRVRLVERLYVDSQDRECHAQLMVLRRTGAMENVLAALMALCERPADKETLKRLSSPTTLAQPQLRAQLRAHACDILERAATTKPVLLLIGELHRGDTLTLELLGGIARELQATSSAVHLVASVRRSALDDRQSDLSRRFPVAHRVPLEALGPRDVAIAVGTMLGRRPPTAELARRLHLATAGQPLYVEQAVQGMVQTGGIEADGSRLSWADQAMDIEVPPYALRVAEGQLESLPVSWRRVLEAFAVVGAEASLPLLARVLGWEPAALMPVIEGLERVGVLRFDPKSLRALWRQPILAQMVLARTAVVRHNFLQRQLVLQTRGLPRDVAIVKAQIAVDLFEQSVRDTVPLARILLANHQYREALDLLDALTSRPHRVAKNPLLAEAYLLHAECLRAVRPADPQAGRSLARAKELAPSRDVELAARLLLGQGRLYGGIGHYRNAEKYVRQAWDTLVDRSVPLKGEVALDLAAAARLRGELHAAETWFEKAMEIAESAGDKRMLWRAAAGGGACMLARGRLGDAEQALSRTMQEAGRAEDPYAFATALASWTEALRHQGRYSEALSQLYLRIPEASQLQDPEPYVRLLLATAWIELDLSRLGRAQECTDTLAATIHRGELLHVRLEVQLLNGRIMLASGQYRTALYTLEEVHQSARKAELTVLAEHARAVLAEAMYAVGDREGGRSMFQSAMLGLLGTGDLTLLAEAIRGRARVEASTRDPQEIFRPVEKLLDEQPMALLRLEQLLARGAWSRAKGDASSGAASHREAAMVLNRIATGLNDTDRAALRVHPWSTWIRRGLVAQAGRGKGPQ
jgi:serine/threonine protein kinase/tetratricopeptide (TPR) repeat protein